MKELTVTLMEISKAYDVERRKIGVTRDVIRGFHAVFEEAVSNLPTELADKYRRQAAALFRDANRRFDAWGADS